MLIIHIPSGGCGEVYSICDFVMLDYIDRILKLFQLFRHLLQVPELRLIVP